MDRVQLQILMDVGFCLILFKGIRRHFDNLAVRLMKTDGKSLGAFVLDIYRELAHQQWHTNTPANTHTHDRLSRLSFFLQLQPFHLEMSMALLSQPHYRERDVENQAKEDTFYFFAVGKQPKPQHPALRQGGFKQPLIHWQCIQTHTHILFSYCTLTVRAHKVHPYSYPQWLHSVHLLFFCLLCKNRCCCFLEKWFQGYKEQWPIL